MVEIAYFGTILSLFVTATNAVYCSKSSFGDTTYMYCATSCCGSSYNRYCCSSSINIISSSSSINVRLIVGVVFGIVALIAIVVTVLVVVFCCCRKSTGRTGQVFQPVGVTSTAQVYGVQTTTVPAGYGQVGYTNAAFPQQMSTSNLPADSAQKLQEPPPSYVTVNPN